MINRGDTPMIELTLISIYVLVFGVTLVAFIIALTLLVTQK